MRWPRTLPCLPCFAANLALLVAGSGAEFSRESAWAAVALSHPSARPVVERGSEGGQIWVYKTEGRSELAVEVAAPLAAGARATIYILHGGGWESGSPVMERPLAAELRRRGYATVLVTYRLGEAGRFPRALEDVADAIRWCESERGRIGLSSSARWVLGCSAGGQMASWLGAVSGQSHVVGLDGFVPVRIDAVVNIDGLMDFTDPALLKQQREKPSAPTRFLGGSFAERPETWQIASPLHQLHPGSAPTLFLRSTAASPLLPGRDEATKVLTSAGILTRQRIFADSPHTFWLFEPWFSLLVEEIDAFADEVGLPRPTNHQSSPTPAVAPPGPIVP